MNGFLFTVLIVALWLSPVLVIVGMVWIARRVDIDLRRQPPPDDIDYSKW